VIKTHIQSLTLNIILYIYITIFHNITDIISQTSIHQSKTLKLKDLLNNNITDIISQTSIHQSKTLKLKDLLNKLNSVNIVY